MLLRDTDTFDGGKAVGGLGDLWQPDACVSAEGVAIVPFEQIFMQTERDSGDNGFRLNRQITIDTEIRAKRNKSLFPD